MLVPVNLQLHLLTVMSQFKLQDNTPDSLNVNVSAPSQTGPKVIAFNLNTSTINVANLNQLGVMYDGKLIPPPYETWDAILHAKSTDNPTFAILVTQSGVQVSGSSTSLFNSQHNYNEYVKGNDYHNS